MWDDVKLSLVAIKPLGKLKFQFQFWDTVWPRLALGPFKRAGLEKWFSTQPKLAPEANYRAVS